MKKRSQVRQRRVVRKVLAGAALLAALSLECLLVGAFSRDVLRPVMQQQMTIDAANCFRGW